MASLKIVSDRLDDNSIKLAAFIPPLRNGQPNFSALERLMREAMQVNPDAFDTTLPTAAQLAHNDGHTSDGGGIVAHDIAAARMRDMLHDPNAWPRVPPADDDEGAPGEPPRCKTGGCDE